MLDSFFNSILGWVIKLGTPWSIIILSLIITAFITFVYKFTTNQTHLKEIRGKQKQYQAEMKNLRHDPKLMMEKQKEAMKLTAQYFRHSMKPMIYTFIPIILIFGWMRNQYPPGTTVLNLGFLKIGWLWSYIIFSMIFSSLIRKILKVY